MGRGEEKEKFHIMKKFRSVRTALLTSYFLLVFVALTVFTMVALHYTKKHVVQNAEEYSVELVERVSSDIDSYMEYLYNTSTLITSDGDVQHYLFDENQDGDYRLGRIVSRFRTIFETRKDIVNVGVVGKNGRCLINYGITRINEHMDENEREWMRRTYEKKGDVNISSSHIQRIIANRDNWVITLSRALRNKNNSKVEGLFFIDLNYNSISQLCNSISLVSNGYVYIVDDEGNMIYHPQQIGDDEIRRELVTEVLNCKEQSFDTEDGKLYAVSRSQETGWTVVGVGYMTDLLRSSAEMVRIYTFSAFMILLAAFVVAFFISNEITKPIKVLEKSMREVEAGNFDNVVTEVCGQNEIGRLSVNFNIMTKQIKNLMEQNVEEQHQKRKSELRALQAQINPHFLYNTLDSIIWMAEWGKNKDVVLMTSSLAKLLRQSISNQNELVSVEEEIEYTRSYLTIQKMRYKDKLEYEIRVEPEMLGEKMPKLIVQPLVENAIYHGIKYKEGKGRVLVEGFAKEKEFIIKVSDDGIGMTEEQLAGLFEKRETDLKRNSVGVRNVQERIQLYYGREYGLTFESGPGEGTGVEIHIPYEQ